jgi:DNA mismatch repair protein MutS
LKSGLQVVEQFYSDEEITDKLLEQLHQVADLERLISKVAVGRINPRELLQLKRSLKAILPVKEILEKAASAELKKLGDQLHRCDFLLEKIDKELMDDAPMLIHQGGIIKEGVNSELDELRGQWPFQGKII